MKPPTPVTKRVKRMQRKLEDASTTYQEIIEVAGPRLEASEDGQEIVRHSMASVVLLFRTKARVRVIRHGIKQKGWFEKNIFPLLRNPGLGDDVGKLEDRVQNFVNDAATTSYKAAQVLASLSDEVDPFADTIFTENFAHTIVSLASIIERDST